jgi:hypothetical protein
MSSENPFFRPPDESTLDSDEVRSRVRAEFYESSEEFLTRLACARVFDSERFEAVLLWLDVLRQCYDAANLPMARSDFSKFSAIANYLETEAEYSRDQKEEFKKARQRWAAVMQQYQLSSEV